MRKLKYLEALDELEAVFKDLCLLASTGNSWHQEQWKLGLMTESIAVRAFSEWEDFAGNALILSLAKDTSALAASTNLTIPKRVTEDMAEALLTARNYLEFKDCGDLKGKAKKWLTSNPFAKLSAADAQAIDELKKLRNYVAHRSRQSLQAYETMLKGRGVGTPFPVPSDFLLSGTPAPLTSYFQHLKSAAEIL